MKTRFWASLLLLLFLAGVSDCRSQNQFPDRQPAVAGQFYPGDKTELDQMLASLFAQAVPRMEGRNVLAIITPHAGYVFSGGVAASSFNQIDPTKEYENIFIIGPSHYVGFEGASVYPGGHFLTPLGPVKVNEKTAKDLLKQSEIFSSRTDAQAREHSVEVEIPFLQHIMKKSFTIVPIVIGSDSREVCARIADVLRPYLNPNNLFVISTDFSHYPPYDDAERVDRLTASAVLSNSPEKLLRTLNRNATLGIPNLATSMCGWAGVLTLLEMTHGDAHIRIDTVEYRNSGDSEVGGKGQVVGYWAIAVSTPRAMGSLSVPLGGKPVPEPSMGEAKSDFTLTPEEKKELLKIARAAVVQNVTSGTLPIVDTASLPATLKIPCGAFVTLNENNELRGCIGRFGAAEPLYKVVQEMAAAASTEDPRFNPVQPSELDRLSIEISVLSPMRKISSIDEIQLGKHGIYIRKGNRSGTFLPQVATETGWNKEEFLGHCAQDKAGIGWNGWKDAEVYVYEALVFSEHDVSTK
jgi:AmmeMemoRadiSam system protein B/AmmeMemoRadiSam system protein A